MYRKLRKVPGHVCKDNSITAACHMPKRGREEEGTHAQMIVLEKKIIIMGDANLILGVNWKRRVDRKGLDQTRR